MLRRNSTHTPTPCDLEMRQYPSHYWLEIREHFGNYEQRFLSFRCNSSKFRNKYMKRCKGISAPKSMSSSSSLSLLLSTSHFKQFSNILAVGCYWKRVFMTPFILAVSRTSSLFQSLLMPMTLCAHCSYSVWFAHTGPSIKIINVWIRRKRRKKAA